MFKNSRFFGVVLQKIFEKMARKGPEDICLPGAKIQYVQFSGSPVRRQNSAAAPGTR